MSLRLFMSLLASVVVGVGVLSLGSSPAMAACANPVACENQQTGDPTSDWQTTAAGDSTIQGYATSFSTNVGGTVQFKISTPSTNYHVDILRLGSYGGRGARLIASGIRPSVTLPQTQPACQTDSTNGLIDCGNWAVSASWTIPSTAVSGVYVAHLVRDDARDPGGDSQIPFVVTNLSSHSDIVVATSDATWEAYNDYGGNSLYSCTVACPAGNPLAYKAAYAVSYNRPFDGAFATDGGASYLYYAEYQMIRFLEQNGYDVSYVSDSDLERNPSLLQNHKVLITSGHDEYWSGNEEANVKAAIASGVSYASFTGNEQFWKTRWANSEAGASTPYRTLITYKETHFNAPVDPLGPSTWTGAWADPRFSPPADGGVPSNALDGQMFVVNSGSADITVPYQYSKLRFWRNTAVSRLASGQSLTLAKGCDTLGYEWDVDADNGFRPPGQIDMSSTTVSGVQPFIDYGSTTADSGTETHNLTLYRAPSGALVFGAGTVQWAWGLDDTNAWNAAGPPTVCSPDPTMQQATVNLFADMGAQPTTLMAGLVSASPSTQTSAPTSTITSPTTNANLQDGSQVSITGTATGSGGDIVAGVEVSADGGATWHPATLTGAAGSSVNWSYSWSAHGNPTATIESRATDDSGNVESPTDATSVNVACPCGIWSTSTTPATAVPGDPSSVNDAGDANSVEVGLKFSSDTFGQVTGIRFYKAAANTGTHVGSLWTAGGQLLASATFAGESASGWQTVTFASPVTILPGTTYVAGYFAPKGHYSATPNYFYPKPAPTPLGGASLNSPPLHAGSNATSANGLYAYASSSTFPASSYSASNYWVDVQFSPSPPPGQVTGVTATAGQGSATISWNAPTSGGPTTTYTVTPYIGSTPQTPVTLNGTPPSTTTTISGLTPNTAYTFTVQASNPAGSGTTSASSNAATPTPLTPPSAPTGVSAVAATGQAQVSWTTPSSNGGTAITGYTVTPYIGATAQTPVAITDGSATSAKITGLTNGTAYSFTVAAVNNIGTGAAGASSAVTPQDTIFDLATPNVVDSTDSNAVTLGVNFTADVGGSVTGIRFYKASANDGTHVGSLWTAGGQLLASATFTGETASGWQTMQFSSPVLIQPGTTYVAAYYAPNGHYSATGNGLASAVNNAPLHALANGTTGNDVYAYGVGSQFPASTYGATNYYVDVTFVPTPPPGQVTGVSATPGQGSATVNWSAPADGGPPASYIVTPYIGSSAQTPVTVSGTPPATTATISGLTPGAAYTFTVQAVNGNGNGTVSDPSNSVTPTALTAPAAPGSVTASPATTSAQVSWTAPSNGGSPITGYTITPYLSGAAQAPTQVLSGTATSAVVTGLTNGSAYTFTVAATNSVGTGTASAASAAVTPANTIFDFTAPSSADAGDTQATVLGTTFKPTANGTVTGIRFYKAPTNTGTHVGSLWTASGQLLGSVTFTDETSSGWQTALLTTPIAVTAGSTYVVSYAAPNGHYSATGGGFNSAVINGPLTAVADGAIPNGVYTYGSPTSFPTNTFNSTNYWVDVLFAPA